MVRQELKQEVTRQALDAFLQKGIKAVKMDDIAAQMSISKRTLYEMFGDKKTLLKECIKRQYQEEQEALNYIVSTSENILEIILKSYERRLEMFRSFNFQYVREICEHPELVKCFNDTEKDTSRRLCNGLRLGVEQGVFRDDVNYEVFDLLFSTQFQILFETDAWKKFPPAEIFQSIVLVNIRGILTEKGQQILANFLENKR